MELRRLLDLAQAGHSDDWLQIADGPPAEFIPAGLVNLGSDEESHWVALHYMFRAVYLPDAGLTLGWGLKHDDWEHPRHSRPDDPVWMPDEEWNGVRLSDAHVFFNGSLVWQVRYGDVNWGAGISGVVPWPDAHHPAPVVGDQAPVSPTWQVSAWELAFAGLLNDLQGNNEFDTEREVEALEWDLHHAHPVDARRARV